MTAAGGRLMSLMEQRGWKGRIVPIERLTDLEEAIRDLYRLRLLDEALYRDQLSEFSFVPPEDLPGARSIIVAAVPVPQIRVIFHWQGGRVPAVVPPTYAGFSETMSAVQDVLAAWLQREGRRLANPRLPLKTLATRSGLAQLGRNNICYVPGMGSFFQLVAAFSDLPCPQDPWQEPEPLKRCESCVACRRRCPTGAIAPDRFLLHAELCLTYHNEAAAGLPAWIDPSWHHCLLGCMRCQSACPENKGVLEWSVDRAEFSKEETAWFLKGTPFEELPEETASRLLSLQLNEEYRILCRNLSLLIARAVDLAPFPRAVPQGERPECPC